MNTNEKGATGEARILLEFVKHGYEVYLPFSGHSVVDLIAADKQMEVKRLQVKYRSLGKYNSFELPRSSVVNGKRVLADLTKTDGWVVYVQDVDRLVYFPTKYLLENTSKLMFRFEGRGNCIEDEFKHPSILWNYGK